MQKKIISLLALLIPYFSIAQKFDYEQLVQEYTQRKDCLLAQKILSEKDQKAFEYANKELARAKEQIEFVQDYNFIRPIRVSAKDKYQNILDNLMLTLLNNSDKRNKVSTKQQITNAKKLCNCGFADENFPEFVKITTDASNKNRLNQNSLAVTQLLAYDAFSLKGMTKWLDSLSSKGNIGKDTRQNVLNLYQKGKKNPNLDDIIAKFHIFTPIQSNYFGIQEYKADLEKILIKYQSLGRIEDVKITFAYDSIGFAYDSLRLRVSLVSDGKTYYDCYPFGQAHHFNPYSPEITFPFQILNQILKSQGKKERFVGTIAGGTDGVFLITKAQKDYLSEEDGIFTPLKKFYIYTFGSVPFYLDKTPVFDENNPYKNTFDSWVQSEIIDEGTAAFYNIHLNYNVEAKFMSYYPHDLLQLKQKEQKLSQANRQAQLQSMLYYTQRLRKAKLYDKKLNISQLSRIYPTSTYDFMVQLKKIDAEFAATNNEQIWEIIIKLKSIGLLNSTDFQELEKGFKNNSLTHTMIWEKIKPKYAVYDSKMNRNFWQEALLTVYPEIKIENIKIEYFGDDPDVTWTASCQCNNNRLSIESKNTKQIKPNSPFLINQCLEKLEKPRKIYQIGEYYFFLEKSEMKEFKDIDLAAFKLINDNEMR